MIFPLYRLSRLLTHVPTWNRSEKGGVTKSLPQSSKEKELKMLEVTQRVR